MLPFKLSMFGRLETGSMYWCTTKQFQCAWKNLKEPCFFQSNMRNASRSAELLIYESIIMIGLQFTHATHLKLPFKWNFDFALPQGQRNELFVSNTIGVNPEECTLFILTLIYLTLELWIPFGTMRDILFLSSTSLIFMSIICTWLSE